MAFIGSQLSQLYQSFLGILPPWAQNFVNLFFLALVVFVYAVIIWKFYRFVARKNIIELNLNKYNKSQNNAASKFLSGVFYFIEYIIVLPFLIFLWFIVFAVILIFLTQGLEVSTVLILSAVIIGAIRMAAYYKEDLSKDLAKLLPFTLLAILISKPNFFNFESLLSQFAQVPSYFSNILTYLLFIIILEIVLRSFDLLFTIIGIEEPDETSEDVQKQKQIEQKKRTPSVEQIPVQE